MVLIRYDAQFERGRPGYVLLLVALFLASGMLAELPAQGPDVSPMALRSKRPVLVNVSFVGNNSVAAADLQSRIQSSPTKLSAMAQLSLAARKSSIWREDAARFLQYRAGTINIRYLNTVVVNQDKEEIVQLYQELGFHDARVRARYTFDTVKSIALLEFVINEGPQYNIWAVSFHGIDPLPSDIRAEVENLRFMQVGGPARVADVDLEVGRILSYLKDNGYPFASEFNRPDVAICPPSKCGTARDSIALYIDPGTRYRIRGVVVSPAEYDSVRRRGPVREAILTAQYEFEPGDWYDRSAIDEIRQRLYRLGVFDEVSFDTAAVDPDAGELSLRLRYAMRDLNEIEGSIETSFVPRTDEPIFSAGVSARYTRRNLFRSAVTLSTGGRIEARLPDLQQIEYSGDVRADIPVSQFLGASLISATVGASRGTADRAGTAKLLAQRLFFSQETTWRFPRHTVLTAASARFTYQENSYENVEDFILERARVEVEDAALMPDCSPLSVQQDLVNVLARNVYRLQVLQGDAPDLRPSQEAKDEAARLEKTIILGGTVVGDHRNDFFSPSAGSYFEARGDLGLTGGLSPIGSFIRLEGDMRIYRTVVRSGVLALRGHMGFILQPPGFPLTPLNMRFHSGGPNSNRGWGSRDMLVTSPAEVFADTCSVDLVSDIIDDSRRLLGGLVLIEANVEFRYSITDTWVLIPFVDVGNAYFRNYSEDADLISVGTILQNLGVAAGLNIGFVTPAGPLRGGVGFPIWNPIDDTKYAFQLSIGHAF